MYQKSVTDTRSNHTFASKDKENVGSKTETRRIGKAVLDKNNSILLIEINKFRLFFKIYEKLRSCASEEKSLLSALGADILRRVEGVACVLTSSDSAKARSKAE